MPRQPTIYVDGGSVFRQPSRIPSVSVGDGDSASLPLDELLPSAKDFSDLAFVLRHIPVHVVQIEMLGFLGGREDHQLANFGEIHHFLSERLSRTQVHMWSPDKLKVAAFCHGSVELEIFGSFSVFSFVPAEVEISGDCRYPLAHPALLQAVSSHGLSNEGKGIVKISSRTPVFVFLN